MLNKKGAMFGLDARIALAIFGALSVISGAALYSAIQEAKITRIITTFDEFEKGLASYLIDTGADMPIHSAAAHEITALELVESAKAGWKGPYLPYKKPSAADHYITDEATGLTFWLHYEKADTWTSADTASSGEACATGKTCSYFLKTHLNHSYSDFENLITQLDERLDNGDGLRAGKFRVNAYTGMSTNPIAFYQLMPMINQP
tara:strand:- start:884 stop:1498 length:615 start_codon:yes stop_codon:yes gene_type:complete